MAAKPGLPPVGGSGGSDTVALSDADQQVLSVATSGEPTVTTALPQPQWLRLTVPDYPHVAYLLLWPDGKVTWK